MATESNHESVIQLCRKSVCVGGITLRAGGSSLKNALYRAWDRQNWDKHNQKLVSVQCIMWLKMSAARYRRLCSIYIFTE